MGEFFNNLRTSINTLAPLEKMSLIGVFFILLVFSLIAILKTFYNAKKIVFKISPIVLSAVLMAILLFIIFA